MTRALAATPLLFATDLDGTLLDEESYGFEAAQEALDALAARDVPLVLASSKTRREMEIVAQSLGVECVLIVENGGEVVLPGSPGDAGRRWSRDGGAVELVLGLERRILVAHLADLARAAGVAVRGFSSCSAAEIARLTGLSLAEAEAAADRRYDEPFLLDDVGAVPRLKEGATLRGLRVSRGGRFWHLGGPGDKGDAFRALLGHWRAEGRTFSTVGLGDAPNDEPLLRAVARPIVIPRACGTVDEELAARVPEAEVAPAPGPGGWNTAVLTVLGGRRLPRVSGGTT